MRYLRGRPRRPPEKDLRLVGISFIDVLFALVINEAFNPIKQWAKIPGVGLAHLGLTIVLVITSWIGYHNSFNRPTYFIRFANLPLAQFVVDILLVGVYWTTAVSAEGSGNSLGRSWSAMPETLAVAISFGLYFVWDRIGLAIRKDARYGARTMDKDEPARRNVTEWCCVLASLVILWVLVDEPESAGHIIAVDLTLVVLLVVFRFWKERSGPAQVGFSFRRDVSAGAWRAEGDDGTKASGLTKQDAQAKLEAALKVSYGDDCRAYVKEPSRPADGNG